MRGQARKFNHIASIVMITLGILSTVATNMLAKSLLEESRNRPLVTQGRFGPPFVRGLYAVCTREFGLSKWEGPGGREEV